MNFINKLLSDNDSVSSKRFVGLVGFFFLAITMVINSFYPDNVAPSKELVSSVEFIVIAALFGTSLDKYFKK